MDTSKIVALSALKSFYESSSDQIDLYMQAALSVMVLNENYKIETIESGINSYFGMDIPTNIVKSITKRMEEANIIKNNTPSITKKTDVVYTLTKHGNEKKQQINSDIRAIKRQENSLLAKLCSHLDNKFSIEKVSELLNSFIMENSYIAAINLNGTDNQSNPAGHEINKKIGEFFIAAENNDPETYEQLQTILLGTIISSNLLTQQEGKTKLSLQDVAVYLDTNVLFSLFNFDDEKVNNSVKKAVNLITEAGASLKIFSHTKEEIIDVLKAYYKKIDNRRYSNGIEVDDMFWRMNKMGITANHARLIISNLDEKLREFKIGISGLKINEDDSMANLKTMLPKIDRRPESVAYDAQSLTGIEIIRGKSSSKQFYLLEKCVAFLLTNDARLARVMSKSTEYKSDKQVPAILTYEQITAIMWLKNNNDTSDTITHDFLSSAIKSKVISNELWDQFVMKLDEYEATSNFLAEDIAEVVSMESTQAILVEKKQNGIDEVLNDTYIAQKKAEREKEKLQIKNLQRKTNWQENEMLTIMQSQAESENEINRLQNEQIKRDAQINQFCSTEALRKVSSRCMKIFLALILFAILTTSLSIYFIPLTSPWQYAALLVIIFSFATALQYIKKDNIFSLLPPLIQSWLPFVVFKEICNQKEKWIANQYDKEKQKILPDFPSSENNSSDFPD